MSGQVIPVECKRCKVVFMARVADRKRGWGKFCSKSCKAKKQESRTGQCAAYHKRQNAREDFGGSEDDDLSWDAHPCTATNPKYGDE